VLRLWIAPAEAVLCGCLLGQSPTPLPAFEVASIKRSAPGAAGATMRLDPGGRFTTVSMTMKNVIQLAYGVRQDDVVGGPAWLNTEEYDIRAKADSEDASQVTLERQKLRLRSLLADRLRLKVHNEPRRQPAYALILSQHGPKMPSAHQGSRPGRSMSMSMLASFLSLQVGRPVLDNTGLSGTYLVKLEWASEDGHRKTLGGDSANSPLSEDPVNGPSIFTAVQEQLGLRLQPKQALREVLVIDEVSRPSAN